MRVKQVLVQSWCYLGILIKKDIYSTHNISYKICAQIKEN